VQLSMVFKDKYLKFDGYCFCGQQITAHFPCEKPDLDIICSKCKYAFKLNFLKSGGEPPKEF